MLQEMVQRRLRQRVMQVIQTLFSRGYRREAIVNYLVDAYGLSMSEAQRYYADFLQGY